jgi:hypothetical protein
MKKLIMEVLQFESERGTDFSDKQEQERVTRLIMIQLKATRRREMSNVSILMSPYFKLLGILKLIYGLTENAEFKGQGKKKELKRLFEEQDLYVENFQKHKEKNSWFQEQMNLVELLKPNLIQRINDLPEDDKKTVDSFTLWLDKKITDTRK